MKWCSTSSVWSLGRVSGTTLPLQMRPVVAPSAPGNRPKYVSNVRFSLTRNTTCLMWRRAAASWRASARTVPGIGVGPDGDSFGGDGDGAGGCDAGSEGLGGAAVVACGAVVCIGV